MHLWFVVCFVALLGVADVSVLYGGPICTWQQWQGWSTCSQTCGGGIRERKRVLRVWPWWKTTDFRRCGKSKSASMESEYCSKRCFQGYWSRNGQCHCKDGYDGICCHKKTPYWSAWGAWSPCSLTCSERGNEGKRVRYRKCLGPADNNVLRGCSGVAALLGTCRPDVPCQDPTTTTPEGDVTTLLDRTETGGSEVTRPSFTSGYTTGRQETPGQEATKEPGYNTEHMDTTVQIEQNTIPLQTTTIPSSDQLNENTTHLQTTTIPPSDHMDTTIGTYTNRTSQLENHTTTEYTIDTTANRTLLLHNDTSTYYYRTTETAVNDDTTIVMQNITATADGNYDNVMNATTESDQILLHTNLPVRNALPNDSTDALPEALTTGTVPGITAGAKYTTTTGPVNGTTMTSQQDNKTTRSVLLDVLRRTSMSDDTDKTATSPEPTLPDWQTTTETTEASVHERRTTERRATSTTTTTTSPVLDRRELRFVIRPRNRRVQLGHSVIFECVTEPSSYITWSFEDWPLAIGKKEGREVLPGGVLIFRRIRRHHIGKYTCTANGQHVVKQTSAWIYIENESLCLPTFTNTPSDAVVREGMLKVFACRTSVESQIIWQKNGRQIDESNDPRIRVLANNYLCISPVNVNDSAKYTCVANNSRTKCVTKHTAKLRVYKNVNEGTARSLMLRECC